MAINVCAFGLVAKYSLALSEGDEQNWVLNSAKGDDLVIFTGQALWSGAFLRNYWLVMTCQKEHAAVKHQQSQPNQWRLAMLDLWLNHSDVALRDCACPLSFDGSKLAFAPHTILWQGST